METEKLESSSSSPYSMNLSHFIANMYQDMPFLKDYPNPWDITNDLKNIIEKMISALSHQDYHISGNVAIHKSAVVEKNVVLRDHIILEEGSTLKSGAYLREGVYLGKKASVGANCELKQSIIFNYSRIAHLNYVGNSIIGEDVNLEAGAVLANHFNERKEEDKEIVVVIDGQKIRTKTIKFGSLLGDGCRIGANSVLNPGTILRRDSVVDRLTHVRQLKFTD